MNAFLDEIRAHRLTGVFLLLVAIPAAAEQQTLKLTPDQAPTSVQPEKPVLLGYGQLHRDFGFPGAVRVWERGMYLNPQPRRSRGLYGSYFPHYGGYGSYYDSYLPKFSSRVNRESYENGYHAYSLRLNHAYALGVAPAEVQAPLAAQAARALHEFQDVMQAGHEAFARGDYGAAARHFLLATQLNQGDPASRLCAAHAEVALGHYDNAALLVRRAFDLQHKLAYLSPDIRGAYGRPHDFEVHLRDLRDAVRESRSAGLWFLLAYYCQCSGDADQSADALEHAWQLDFADPVIRRFAASTGQ